MCETSLPASAALLNEVESSVNHHGFSIRLVTLQLNKASLMFAVLLNLAGYTVPLSMKVVL